MWYVLAVVVTPSAQKYLLSPGTRCSPALPLANGIYTPWSYYVIGYLPSPCYAVVSYLGAV